MTAVAYRLPNPSSGPRLQLVPPLADSRRSSIYLRRRIAAAAIATLLLVAGYSALAEVARWASAGVSARPAPVAHAVPVAAKSWTVAPGDTLWGIVQASYPGEDPRPIVHKLSQSRGGSALQVGERIALP